MNPYNSVIWNLQNFFKGRVYTPSIEIINAVGVCIMQEEVCVKLHGFSL